MGQNLTLDPPEIRTLPFPTYVRIPLTIFVKDKPHNPLVNSGAIMSVALLLNLVRPDLVDMAAKFDFVLNYIKVEMKYTENERKLIVT